ncbi:hypothetical protein SAMN05216474_2190 [Lishizhenia tianjinensis]|uniref:HD domain-containing protein n=1 Tax=Lishizhenia tianjinensis TaxID=477690 RepID=A0A1I7AL01_9FLAO|nr:HD domain-containing protein [Lishizhenia tianjinensis]SFT75596.1 hypothetical protein SAMN05216474_2190 [Lishizhenia tianjinensis]
MNPNSSTNNKKKIINDPVYGFVSIPNSIVFDIIQHPYFQRLRRITQLGLTHLVYPGAHHTRFHHCIGATHLMSKAVQVIRRKGHFISEQEERAVMLAILLHDIGHGPYSHTLEHDIVKGISHEKISALFIKEISKQFKGELDLALLIFNNKYHKPFLHQLVSSQLDMDRMDYLNRDSFYTGVSEGVIGSDRIIEMLNVVDDKLVMEEKGIYSIEKFIVARRLMYWQVYLHKTVVAAEWMLMYILRRAKELSRDGHHLFASPALQYFLERDIKIEDFEKNAEALNNFAQLDDFDIMGAIKVWQFHEDTVLARLSKGLVNRDLFKIEISTEPFGPDRLEWERQMVQSTFNIAPEDAHYFVYTDKLVNNAYNTFKENINVLYKDGRVVDVSKAADNLNISALTAPVEKYFLCYPVEIRR